MSKTASTTDRKMQRSPRAASPPDDSSELIEATENEAERIRAKFEEYARAKVKKEIDEQVEKPQHGST